MTDDERQGFLSKIETLEAENAELKEGRERLKALEAGYHSLERASTAWRTEYSAARRRVEKLEKITMGTYVTVTNRKIDVSKLSAKDAALLRFVLPFYKANPEYERFGEFWMREAERMEMDVSAPSVAICKDLERRLGIVQERVGLADYRDWLKDTIETVFGDEEGFRKSTGIKAEDLAKVLEGKPDTPLGLVTAVLAKAGAVLVLQSEKEARENCQPKKALEPISFLSR